jgi:hypothetical protein
VTFGARIELCGEVLLGECLSTSVVGELDSGLVLIRARSLTI